MFYLFKESVLIIFFLKTEKNHTNSGQNDNNISIKTQNDYDVIWLWSSYICDFQNQAENELVDSVMVVFSVEDGKSFKNGVKKIEMIRQEIQFDKPLFLVANKVDLARHRVVTEKGTHPKKIIFYIAYFKISTILIYFLFLDEIIYY